MFIRMLADLIMHTESVSASNAEVHLRAAGRSTARFGLWSSRADEGTRHLSLDLRCDLVHIHSGFREKRTRISDLVHPPGVELDVNEACGLQLRNVLLVSKSAGHASDPQLHAPANFRRHVPTNDDVRHCEPPTRFQDAEGLPQHGVFVD
jgi:hypothetical protein